MAHKWSCVIQIKCQNNIFKKKGNYIMLILRFKLIIIESITKM